MRLISRLSGATWAILAVLAVAVAGIVHIVLILLIPWRSDRDAFARVSAMTGVTDRANLNDAVDRQPFRDPSMLTDICRFDLGSKPFRLALSPFADRFVSIGFHSRHGLTFYGLTVHAADATSFDLVLVRKDARDEATPEQDAHRVVVTAPEPDGFVTLSTPLGEGSERDAAEDRLGRIECRWDAEPAS